MIEKKTLTQTPEWKDRYYVSILPKGKYLTS